MEDSDITTCYECSALVAKWAEPAHMKWHEEQDARFHGLETPRKPVPMSDEDDNPYDAGRVR
jgi:hypothetical protein